MRVGIVRGPFGNVASVVNAFRFLGEDVDLLEDADQIPLFSHLVLPGVGSFAVAMDFLEAAGLVEPIRSHVAAGGPLLGICLGCQLLMDEGQEGGARTGLGLIAGQVVPLADRADGLPLPHTGWNLVTPTASGSGDASPIPAGYYYFNHEFIVEPRDQADTVATVDYGATVPVAVMSGSVLGLQFHPEKSQALGLRILQEFIHRGSGIGEPCP